MKPPVPSQLSPVEVGLNIRTLRRRRGLSQAETAEKAGVSERTLRRLETGRSVRAGTLERVCEALGWNATEASTSIRLLPTEAGLFRHHASESTVWYVTDDRRRQVPEDDLARIQDPGERHRLGSLGLVDMFVGTFRFSLPEGPGLALFEVYGPVAFGGGSYRELFLYCLRGAVTFTIEGRPIEVEEGGLIQIRRQPVDLRPTRPVTEGEPAPLLLHVGTGVVKGAPPRLEPKEKGRRRDEEK